MIMVISGISQRMVQSQTNPLNRTRTRALRRNKDRFYLELKCNALEEMIWMLIAQITNYVDIDFLTPDYPHAQSENQVSEMGE